MAIKAPVQDKGGVVKDILLVSQVPINVNVTMSVFEKIYEIPAIKH